MEKNYENILEIPEITDATLKYFVNDKFVGNITLEQTCKIRLNVVKYIIDNKDISILDKFYFIGHKDSNTLSGEEIKITMDKFGNFSESPWELNHVRRSMFKLMEIERTNINIFKEI